MMREDTVRKTSRNGLPRGYWRRLVFSIAQKEFKHLKNDPISIRLMIFPVLLQVFVMGYAITTEIRNTHLTICDKSRTPESRLLTETLASHRLFNFIRYADAESDIRSMIDSGAARIGVVIPIQFAVELRQTKTPALGLIVDGQDANAASVAAGYVNAIVAQWSHQYLERHAAARGAALADLQPATIDPVVLFNPLLQSTWYMVPALAVLLVTMVTALLTGFSIVREKESGTLEQLMVTPLGAMHLVVGKSIPFMLIGLLELSAILLFATLWFQIPFRGSYLVLVGFSLVYMFTSIGIGIMVSTVSRTPHQALFITWFILLFFILLSGFFIPVENMPDWVRTMTVVNPVRWFMAAIREIFLKGSGPLELWREALALAGIGLAVYGAAIAGFQRKAR